MPDISSLIQQGATNLWVFIPTAILLGALHGLEPGHSKTMMAAFIIAIRGTVTQAALLGLSATISHTAIVWIVAFSGIYFLGGKFDAGTTEPYFQLASGILIIAIALWMMHRNWKHQHNFQKNHPHAHNHDESRIIHTGHGHEHADQALAGLDLISPGYQDAHELAHANDIRNRFTDRSVTTGQIIMFGLTGGLIPCPASITVLILCLQLKKIALGASLVICFSIGLALTMVAAGTVAALSINKVTRRWSGFGIIASRAPYLSGVLIIAIGLYIIFQSGMSLLH